MQHLMTKAIKQISLKKKHVLNILFVFVMKISQIILNRVTLAAKHHGPFSDYSSIFFFGKTS